MNKRKRDNKNYLFPIFIAVICVLEIILLRKLPFFFQIGWLILLNTAIYLIYLKLHKKNNEEVVEEEIRNEAIVNAASGIFSYISDEVPIGVISWDDQNKVTWVNHYVQAIIKKQVDIDSNQLLQEIQVICQKRQQKIKIAGGTYKVIVDSEKKMACLIDISEQEEISNSQLNNQITIGILSIDNYDDAIEKMDDKEVSYLNSFVTTLVSDWMAEFGVYVKRLNSERYFFVSRYVDLNRMVKKKFDLLDLLRKEAENQNIPITLSIGIAYGYQTLDTIGKVAQSNLDLALIRGGDQVVLRESTEDAKPVYYGGKSSKQAKRSRVRSRAMSTALKNNFEQVEDIYIMGHRYPDMDALGAAFGVQCLADFANKEAKIILNPHENIPDVERCLQEIYRHPIYENVIVTPEEAMKAKTENSLLVMVDYHKPSLSISEELYETFDKIIIIDHHRRGEEFPSKPLLSYIESSASSASELVAEIIQQQSTKSHKLDKFAATLLLAGMVVDTKSFAIRTTSRTFDVASYLRSIGADGKMIQYFISTELSNYLEINDLISKSEYVTADIVVAIGSEQKVYDSITAAKTADTLLSMNGINAAFVVTKRTDGLIGISARSTGTVNVQVIMEAMGGGGHFTNAATQIADGTISEIKEQLLQIINENINQIYEGE